ncbi:MAG: hypothetical protein P8M78_08375 [Myxococcota bacterium]|nr:hypothetical protein [Myxococcota bacterium]
MITSMDDYLIHQTTEPIAHPDPTDRNFYDRYWMNGYDVSGDFLFECGLGVYPNRRVMDGHWSVSVGGVQHCFHASRRAPYDRTESSIGPLTLEVVEPMRSLRVHLAENETGLSCDLLFTARSVPHQEPKNILFDELRCVMNTSRFTQMGRWSGWFSVGGDRVDLQPDRSLGTRDKSWGVRPIGEPVNGAPPRSNQEPGVYWVWSPIAWDDGTTTQFGTFEDHDGRPTQLSAHRLPLYDDPAEIPRSEDEAVIEMAEARHEIEWEKGTRRPSSAAFELLTKEGQVDRFRFEPVARFQMLALGYQHPEWAHGVWKGEEEIAGESWRLDEVSPLDYKNIHVHHVGRAVSESGLSGFGTLETLCFGRHAPSGFDSILDGAP